MRSEKDGKVLVKEKYDAAGNVEDVQYFNKDTVPDGPMIHCYPNGKIATWRWFSTNSKDPLCGIFYNKDGTVDTLKGDPFIDAFITPGGETYIKVIHPPQIDYVVKFTDTYEGDTVYKTYYEPIITDSVNWVNMEKYDYKNGHQYSLTFCIADRANRKILQRYSSVLNPELLVNKK